MKEEKLLFEVDDFKVYKDSIYVVRDKEDLSAPSGFINAGVTKLPSDGVSDTFQCKYVRKSASSGVWDTGFNEYSPCYKGLDKDVVKYKISLLEENVIEPYRLEVGKRDALSHSDDNFWSSTNFRIYAGQVFNTDSPSDVLTLYFALLTKQITPKGYEGDSRYNQSSYIVVDVTKDVKKKDERSAKKFKAVGMFEMLLSSDRQRLLAMLNYANLVVAPTIDDDAFRGIFDQYLNSSNSNSNTDTFLRLVEETNEEEGRAKIDIYLKLKDLYNRSNKVTRNPNGIYFYEEKEIGPDLKSAASNIAKTKDLKQVKKELLLGDED